MEFCGFRLSTECTGAAGGRMADWRPGAETPKKASIEEVLRGNLYVHSPQTLNPISP